MCLNHCGRMIADVWTQLPEHYRYVALDEFVIMPDHLHGLLSMTAQGDDAECGAARHGLPEIIRAFKSFSAREVNKAVRGKEPVWQRGYYDSVIRGPHHLDRVRSYIRENPARRWVRMEEGGLAGGWAGLRGPTGGS